MGKNNRMRKGCVLVCLVLISLFAFSQQQNIPQQNTKTFTNKDLVPESNIGSGQSGSPSSSSPAQQKQSKTPQEEGQVSYYLPPTPKKSQTIAGASASEIADLLNKPIFQQKVTLVFKDADLQDVIRLIAKKTGINVIMSKKVVRGTVTVHLEDVPLGVALDVILKTNGLGYVLEKGDIVRIVPRKMVQIKPVEVETKLFFINWVP
ncbi:secretin and TonB N-terminal domain-containing protein, partial [Candidatus Sumerlaeota bacterium]|nr:secretin and TonB N-terminal domain-containing protein [Candidatus Sumerlaeota bacterium]